MSFATVSGMAISSSYQHQIANQNVTARIPFIFTVQIDPHEDFVVFWLLWREFVFVSIIKKRS